MSDPKALTRVLDEFFWTLRRAGLAVSTAQAIDAAKVAALLGVQSEDRLQVGLAAVLAHSEEERARFDREFRRFFGAKSPKLPLRDRLLARGLREEEVSDLLLLLNSMAATTGDMAPLGAVLEQGADLDRLLSLVTGSLTASAAGIHQLGFVTHRVLQGVGVPKARKSLAALSAPLSDAFGEERAQLMMAALKAEVDAAEALTRTEVKAKIVPDRAFDTGERSIGATPLAALDADEVAEVRRAVARFAARLRGRSRVRERRGRRGVIDPHRTLRSAFATGGVPFRTLRKRPRRDRPVLMLLCDVSDSVRATSTFMLELVYAAQELWDGTRTFVFVSDLGETTALFARMPIERALADAYSGALISVRDNSNYGRALTTFAERHLRDVDRRTTVVILGDGRTNYLDDAAQVLDAVRERARALIWFCPEAKSEWGVGDSAMARYAPRCTKAFEVRSVDELKRATRAMIALR